MLVEVRARSEEIATTGDEGLDPDLFGKMTGIAVQGNQRKDVIVVDGFDEIAGRPAPGGIGDDWDQGELLA